MEIILNDKKKKDAFISIFNLLKCSSNQTNLTIDKDLFHAQGLDKSHVCLLNLNLKDEWFDSYNVDNKIQLCFNTSLFYSIISTKSEDQTMRLYLKDNLDYLLIEFKNIDNTKKTEYNKFFKMPLLEYDYEELTIPNQDYDVDLTLPSKKITDILLQLNNFGDKLNIKCLEDYVDFTASGESNDVEMRVNIPVDDITSYAIVENQAVNLTYSLNYISKLCITNKLSTEIDFSLSNDLPMKINYYLGNNSNVVCFITPQISDD